MPIDAATLRGNFVWDAFDRHHRGPRRRRPSGFTDINCPMCISRGESVDRRYRCGVKPSVDGLGINCFNCGYKGGWTRGRRLSKDVKEFLGAVGVPEVELARLDAMASLVHRQTSNVGSPAAVIPPSGFPNAALPPGARSIDAWAADGCENPDFIDVARYLMSRGEAVQSWSKYAWTPSQQDGMNRRLILPFTYGEAVVGFTARAIDGHVEQRYTGKKPAGYLFNNAALRLRSRKYIVLVEGAFDAIAIDGVGLLGSTVTDSQAAWLKSTGQTVIVVPDQDKAGGKLIDQALHYGWHVAFPKIWGNKAWWENDTKDVADAVKRYGRLWVLTSIIETATSDAAAIAVKRLLR